MTALVIAGVAVKEGRESWRGDSCCTAAIIVADSEAHEDDRCEDDCCD